MRVGWVGRNTTENRGVRMAYAVIKIYTKAHVLS